MSGQNRFVAIRIILRSIHIPFSIDIVIGFFNSKTQSILNAITYTLCALTCALVTYWGGVTTWDQYQRGILDIKAIEIPKFIVVIIIL
jgi:TRAP-type C4-dicarboxylate transport system permease small subunit